LKERPFGAFGRQEGKEVPSPRSAQRRGGTAIDAAREAAQNARMSTTAQRFADRHVAITGAGSGIGRAIALRLAREGARVALLGRRVDKLDAVAREIAALPGAAPALALRCDIRERAAVDACFTTLRERAGPLHAFVANSGVGGANAAGAGDRFDELVQTNLIGTYSSLRAAERVLAPGPEPRHFVVLSSILARLGVPGYTGYCASKAGLLGLVRALAQELAPANVQVNAILPGWVETEMAHEGLAGMAAALKTTAADAKRIALEPVPLRRFAEPEDVAGLVAYLLSPDARGITGACLDMNNGALMS
jgi:NAD(P)-dependent dehydrogenase (short-subunit alcohol dehydrogenase family)